MSGCAVTTVISERPGRCVGWRWGYVQAGNSPAEENDDCGVEVQTKTSGMSEVRHVRRSRMRTGSKPSLAGLSSDACSCGKGVSGFPAAAALPVIS